MHTRKPTIAAVSCACVATALVAAGCGGEAGRAPETATVITVMGSATVPLPPHTARITDPARAAYVKQVDAVCRTRNPERDADVKAAADASSEQDAVDAYDRSITTADEQLREIEAVKPPARDADLITTNVIDRLKQRLALRRKLSQALADDDAGAASRDRAELDALTIALQSFARGYGFSDCGSK